MKTLLITGGTGHLGPFVIARIKNEYNCIVLRRGETPSVSSVFGVLHLAGGFSPGSSPDDFAKMLDANLMSGVRAIEAVRGKIEDGGRIVAISALASLTWPKGIAAYNAAKSALNAYLETLAKELHERRITVNALLPSALGPNDVPYERVADVIAFLLSDAADKITGQLIAMSA